MLSVHRKTQGKVAGNRGNLRKPIGNRRKPLRKPLVFEEVLSENTIFGHTPGSIYITKLKVGSPPPRPGACGSPTTKPARSARFLVGGGSPSSSRRHHHHRHRNHHHHAGHHHQHHHHDRHHHDVHHHRRNHHIQGQKIESVILPLSDSDRGRLRFRFFVWVLSVAAVGQSVGGSVGRSVRRSAARSSSSSSSSVGRAVPSVG